MSITNSKSITELKVNNSGDQDVVSEVIVRFLSVHSSGVIEDTIRSFNLDTTDRSSTSDGWVPYGDLTEETVFGWITDLGTYEDRYYNQNETFINQRINPARVYKDLPTGF